MQVQIFFLLFKFWDIAHPELDKHNWRSRLPGSIILVKFRKADFVQNTITAVAETFCFFEWENSDKNAM